MDRMLDALGVPSLAALIDETVPESIRLHEPLALPAALTCIPTDEIASA